MPNFVDLTKYDYKKIPEHKDTGEIVIGYMGGSSHFLDVNKPEFTKAMKIIMEKYPNVRLKTTFYMPSLKAIYGYKYKYMLGRHNIYRFISEVWPEMMDCDFMVAPLSWSNYSRSKSYIKYLEYSAGKKACILEDIDPYNEVLQGHPERGLIAHTTEDWVKNITYLIENPKERKLIGENAYKYVKENHTMQKNAGIYASYFRSLVDKKAN